MENLLDKEKSEVFIHSKRYVIEGGIGHTRLILYYWCCTKCLFLVLPANTNDILRIHQFAQHWVTIKIFRDKFHEGTWGMEV